MKGYIPYLVRSSNDDNVHTFYFLQLLKNVTFMVGKSPYHEVLQLPALARFSSESICS